jgi:hypothetical protein
MTIPKLRCVARKAASNRLGIEADPGAENEKGEFPGHDRISLQAYRRFVLNEFPQFVMAGLGPATQQARVRAR